MPEIEIEMIEPREPSVEFIRDMIQDADDKFNEWRETKPTELEKNSWIRRQMFDLIVVNKQLKKLEEPF